MPFAPIYAERLDLIRDLPPMGPTFTDNPTNQDKLDAFYRPFGPPEPTSVTVEDREIPGPLGAIPVRIYRPATASPSDKALVWYHGGAFLSGDLDMPEADLVSRGLATRSAATIISVFYRLCLDGIHHPVPHDDCYSAYLWVRQHAADLGFDPTRIAVGGASAGGNLAASVTLHAAREGLTPWQALLAYPVVHHGLPQPSPELAAALEHTPPVLRFLPQTMEEIDLNYLGDPLQGPLEYAYPGHAHDLDGFPDTYIENAEFDDLRASGEEFARQLRNVGVSVDMHLCEGAPHGHLNAVGSPVTAATLDRFAARLCR